MIRLAIQGCVLSALFLISGLGGVNAQAPDEAQMREMMQKMQQQMQGGMDGEQMQRMMEQASAMQQCIERIDKSALESMQADSIALNKEVKALCAAGDRDEAQSKVVDYGKRIADSKELKQMRECSAGMRDLMPDIASMMPQSADDPNFKHVCDGQ